MKDIVNDAEKRLEHLICEFIYSLASPAPETSKEEILSQDYRFMRVVKKIHEDRHKGFERGYKQLRSSC
jgi:hypothetical protein